MKKKYPILLSLSATLLFISFSSCTTSKRASLAKLVTASKKIEAVDKEKITTTFNKKEEKKVEENIDSTINANVSTKLNQYKKELDSFSKAISFIEANIKSGKLFRKNKNEIQAQVKKLENYTKNNNLKLRRFEMIENGLTISQQYLFNLAAFFGPGKYQIPTEKIKEAEQSFSPILDSLANFYNKYKDVERQATLIVLGFADGTGFNKESETYKTLTSLLNDSLASKEAVNQKLSQLRAKNIANIMELMLDERIPNYKNIQQLDFLFLETGKGEEYPSKKNINYSIDDERRRVVLLFWSILPK
jgi:outer membrane protein OmpA-like peptidoglycan-associated protein